MRGINESLQCQVGLRAARNRDNELIKARNSNREKSLRVWQYLSVAEGFSRSRLGHDLVTTSSTGLPLSSHSESLLQNPDGRLFDYLTLCFCLTYVMKQFNVRRLRTPHSINFALEKEYGLSQSQMTFSHANSFPYLLVDPPHPLLFDIYQSPPLSRALSATKSDQVCTNPLQGNS